MQQNQPYRIQFDQFGTIDTGYLTAAQYEEFIPFEIKRVFWNYRVPEHVQRGNHAYYTTQQVLVAVHGTVDITLESVEGEKTNFRLAHPGEGLYLPPHVWRSTQFSADAVLLVLSSHSFDPADNLRDYAAFKALPK